MAHAGGGGRLAAAPGCPRRGLPLLAGGGGEQPPARPPGLSGGLETADSAQPGAGRGRGWTKGTRGGEGAAGGKEGSPGRELGWHVLKHNWRRGLWGHLGYFHGKGNGNVLQYSCLGNSMYRGVWQAIDHGVTKELDMIE